MKPIPRWALVSAGAAPVVLIGGWTIAGARQASSYNPLRDTISALAGYGATDRWIMTSALAGLGASYVVTAAALKPSRALGRLILAGGGIATILVAAFPQPADGNSMAHTVVATIAFVSLAIWPAVAANRGSPIHVLTPRVASVATVVMLGLVVWFAAEIHGGERGLAERFAAGAEALWPFVVVISGRRNSLGSP